MMRQRKRGAAGSRRTLSRRDRHRWEKLRLTRSQKTSIQNLANEWTRLAAELSQVQKTIGDLTGQLTVEQAELDGLAPPRPTESLELALRQALDQGDLEGSLEAAASSSHKAEAQAARALAQLPYWTGTLEDLQAAAVPTAERSIALRSSSPRWTRSRNSSAQRPGTRPPSRPKPRPGSNTCGKPAGRCSPRTT